MLTNELKSFMDKITSWRIPGADCVIYHNNEKIFRYQAGYADVEAKRPVTPDLLYNIYSATKVVTCTAALQLFEKGEFLLTDPVCEYMPEFQKMYIKVPSNDGYTLTEAKNPITIANLFSMTAGLTYDCNMPPILRVKEETNGRCPTREIVRAMAENPISFEPGTHWQYSFCHDVLGALIEVVSGQKLGDYMKKNIFEPLGMKNTGFSVSEDVISKMASQYQFNGNADQYEKISLDNKFRLGSEYQSGGAGLISCVDDYIKLIVALTNGGVSADGVRILSSRTVELMRTNQLDETMMKDFNWRQLIGYGYGLGVRTLVSKAASGSLGPIGEFGWDGAAGAYMIIDPENKLSVFYAQHMLNGQHAYVHPRLRNIIYKNL